MAATPKRLAKGTLTAATTTAVYTVGANTQTIITSIRVSPSSAAATAGDIVAYVNGTADSDAVAAGQSSAGSANYPRPSEITAQPAFGAPSNTTQPRPFILNAGDILYLKAVNASGYVVSGVEVT